MKIRFIEEARHSWKLLSVAVSGVWALIVGTFVADPMLAVTVWNAIPAEIRELLPPWVRYIVAAASMFGTIYLARVIKQPVTKAGEISEAAKQIKEVAPEMPKEQLKVAAERMVDLRDAALAERKQKIETQL